MKKILLTTFCVLTAFCAMAQSKKTYTEPLIVTINGLDSDPQDASVVVVDNGNGTINFELQNFFLATGGESMPVGNISIENLPVTKGEDGLDYITFDGSITIQPGDMEGVDMWMGPAFGDIPMKLKGKMNQEKLYVTIDIDMQETIHQICYVQLGTDDFPNVVRSVYTEPLIVTVNGVSTEPQDASVVVIDNGNGTINFELQNFFLSLGGNDMPVGTIRIENLPVTKGEDGLDYITFDGSITIQPGDMEGVDMWMGPALGDIPMKLKGKMNQEKLYVTIDIDMQETIHQICYVQLGTDDFSAASKLGDLNGDGMVDIADAVTVLNIMAAGEYNADADVNHDQTVDIADFVTILNIMAAQ
ncbi:MAG: hypothetical protein K6G92_10050 [Bacteroidaceae bacterium]|nr:hypothetical protein [Bacteroidaceae bacterium]